MRPYHQRADLTATTGATTTSRDNRLPEGGILWHVSTGVDSGVGPIRISVHINFRGTDNLQLFGGWVRGPISPSRAADLNWSGEIHIPVGARLHLVARNDTGTTSTVTMFWAGMVPVEDPDE